MISFFRKLKLVIVKYLKFTLLYGTGAAIQAVYTWRLQKVNMILSSKSFPIYAGKKLNWFIV